MEYAKNSSIERAHAILHRLSLSRDGLSFGHLQTQIGKPVAATLSRLLKALQAESLVVHDETNAAYKCGPALLGLARNCLGSSHVELIQRGLDELSSRSGQSALCCKALITDEGLRCQHFAKSEHADGLHFGQIGSQQFLLSQAFGWPLLDQAGADERQQIIRSHLQHGGDSREVFEKELAALKLNGVFVRPEIHASHPIGCTRIVAPLLIAHHHYSIGITVFGRTDNGLHPERVNDWAAAVRQTARNVQEQCGAKE